MINQDNFSILLIAVSAMAILTALSRLLPFFLPEKSPIMRFFMQENSPIAPLGGAIIAAMTVVLGLPFVEKLSHSHEYAATVAGVIVTVVATLRGINTGFAVLIGMAGFLVVTLVGAYLF